MKGVQGGGKTSNVPAAPLNTLTELLQLLGVCRPGRDSKSLVIKIYFSPLQYWPGILQKGFRLIMSHGAQLILPKPGEQTASHLLAERVPRAAAHGSLGLGVSGVIPPASLRAPQL